MSIYWKLSKSLSVVDDPNQISQIFDFDDIVIEDVKYLPSSFNGDVTFILPPVKNGIPDVYGKAMDGIDNIYDGHAWCRTKTTNI